MRSFRIFLYVAVGATATVPASCLVAQEAAAAAEVKRAPLGFFEIIFAGGPIGIAIMVAIIALSLTAAYLVFDHLLSIRRGELLPEGLDGEVRDALAAGNLTQAAHVCRERMSLLSFVLLHGLSEADGGWPAVEKAAEDALAEQSARLFRKLEYLSLIGNLAPMLGVLGTVVGMIFVFQRASAARYAVRADLEEGIYLALATTAAGLMVAIPSLGAFTIFRNRVDQFIAEAAYLAQHALAPLKRRKAQTSTTPPAKSGPTPPPPP